MRLRSGKVIMPVETQEQRQTLTCCSKDFGTRAALAAHQTANGCPLGDATASPSQASNSQATSQPACRFPCSCGKAFKSQGALSAHRQAKHPPPPTCAIKSKQSSANPSPGPAPAHDVSFPCRHCGKIFNALAALQNHAIEKHELTSSSLPRPLHCQYCAKNGYKRSEDLEQHIRAKHPKKLIVQVIKASTAPQGLHCPICTANGFSANLHLNQHMDAKHPSCPRCTRRFGGGYDTTGVFRTGAQQPRDHQTEECHLSVDSTTLLKKLPNAPDARISTAPPTSEATQKRNADQIPDLAPAKYNCTASNLRRQNIAPTSRREQGFDAARVAHELSLARRKRIGKWVIQPTDGVETAEPVDTSERLPVAMEFKRAIPGAWIDDLDGDANYEDLMAEGGVVLQVGTSSRAVDHRESPPSSGNSHDESLPYSDITSTETRLICHFSPDEHFDSPKHLQRHMYIRHSSCPQCMMVFHGEGCANVDKGGWRAMEQLLEHSRISGHCYCAEHDMVFVSVEASELHVMEDYTPRRMSVDSGWECQNAKDLEEHISTGHRSMPTMRMRTGGLVGDRSKGRDLDSSDVDNDVSDSEMSEDGGVPLS